MMTAQSRGGGEVTKEGAGFVTMVSEHFAVVISHCGAFDFSHKKRREKRCNQAKII